MEIDGREYSFLIGSDVQRNGMYVEVSETSSGQTEDVAELFCPFEKQEMLLTLWREYVPIEVIEAAVKIAREDELIGR